MSSPFFSIVVPTRERAATLGPCLQTCLTQDFDDYEVVVCDNFSSPPTCQVVQGFTSPRIRYLRTDRPLAMSANWEYAVSEARGEYVTVLGDDDGLMPYALRELARLIRDYHQPAAVRWNRAIYTWPTIAVPEDANYLMVPLSRTVTWADGRERIRGAIEFRHGVDHLPMIYNAVIRRDVIAEHRRRVGRVFPNIYPDIYTGFGFGWLAGRFLSVEVPMNVAGLAGRSNGVATLLVPDGNPIASEFNSLNREYGYLPHPRVPNLPLMPIHTVDSFEYAKQFFFPDDDSLSYDRRAMTERYLASIPHTDTASREHCRKVIRDALADRPDLQEWFDREAPHPPPCPWYRLKPAELGYDGQYLRVDTSRLGVSDIADAVTLAAALLGFGNREVRYDPSEAQPVPSPAVAVEAELARMTAERDRLLGERTELLRAVSHAQRDGAIRNLPRKVARRVLRLFRAS
jgi:glycosyltransferase involved in cell wall biosynthesis